MAMDPTLATGRRADETVGHGIAEQAAGGAPGAPARRQHAAAEPAVRRRRKELDAREVAAAVGPLQLVGLGAVQQVVLPRPVLDGRLDGETHGDEADAVPGERRIEAGLVERERRPVSVAVQRGHRTSVEAQDEQPEPAALEADPADFVVEGAELGGCEGLGAATLIPAAVVQLDEHLQRRPPVRLAADLLEADVELLGEVPETALEVVAVGGPQ